MEARCHQVLDAAYRAGVRYFDAARSYGFAEAFLGSWLRTRQPFEQAPTIGSKWGYTYTGAWRRDAPVHEVKDLSAAAFDRQLAETKAGLGDAVRLYQIHSATLESGVLEDLAVLKRLAALRAGGVAVGLTVTGPRQAAVIRRAFEVAVDGVNPFQTVQATWNVLEPSAGAALAEAHERGWGVIVKEALANGRLTDQYGGDRVGPLRRHTASLGVTIDALALAAVLSQDWADVVLSGAVTPEQLQSNLDALDIHVSPDTLPAIAQPADEYWEHRRGLAWQ
jgi:aryl-alcohol dehydrogenase-like predicted oxidoreductase